MGQLLVVAAAMLFVAIATIVKGIRPAVSRERQRAGGVSRIAYGALLIILSLYLSQGMAEAQAVLQRPEVQIQMVFDRNAEYEARMMQGLLRQLSSLVPIGVLLGAVVAGIGAANLAGWPAPRSSSR